MKGIKIGVVLSALAFSSAQAATWHGAAGLGPDYAGVGGKISVVSDGLGLSLGLGCSSYNTENGSQCGASISAINSRWLDPANNRHGIAVYAGLVDDKVVQQPGNLNATLDPVYGVGIGYQYHHNGLTKPGLQLAIYLSHENDIEKETLLRWQIGYQF